MVNVVRGRIYKITDSPKGADDPIIGKTCRTLFMRTNSTPKSRDDVLWCVELIGEPKKTIKQEIDVEVNQDVDLPEYCLSEDSTDESEINHASTTHQAQHTNA